MAREISQREFRNESGKIMRELGEGETFVVTRNGVPVGELTPVARAHFVSTEDVMAVFAGAPPVDGTRFRNDLDSYFDQSIVLDD